MTDPQSHPLFKQIPNLWETVVETMDEALFIVDLHQDVVYFNRRAEQITGFVREQVVGRHCLAAFRCQQCAVSCGLFEHERIVDREIDIRNRDGSTVTVVKNAVVLRDADGRIVGGLETFRDVSALKEQIRNCSTARNQAEHRERILQAVLGGIQEGIVALDADAKVVSINRRAREILGLDDEAAALGQSCHQLLGSDLCEHHCVLTRPTGPRAKATPDQAQRGRSARLNVAGRAIRVSEAASPLLDDAGKSLGYVLVLTELAPDELADHGEGFHGLLGRSPAMTAVFERLRQLSRSEVSVLITGDSGTGKELAARALHATSPRAHGPFVAVNCAALPDGLLESEMFGHVKGAFTGAVRDRRGRVELAQGGTLFLDEVGELSPLLQAKLLRLLQERTFERVGAEQTRQADIRVVAATNRDLDQAVAAGRFREDLYYRLKVVPLWMPPLRQRGRDIVLLAVRLLEKRAQQLDRTKMHFSRAATEALLAYSWPGNVRELVNTVEYVVALAADPTVQLHDLPPEVANSPPATEAAVRPTPTAANPMANGEAAGEHVRQALIRNDWHRIQTAQELGINRVTLYRLMRRFGIEGPRGRRRPKTLERR